MPPSFYFLKLFYKFSKMNFKVCFILVLFIFIATVDGYNQQYFNENFGITSSTKSIQDHLTSQGFDHNNLEYSGLGVISNQMPLSPEGDGYLILNGANNTFIINNLDGTPNTIELEISFFSKKKIIGENNNSLLISCSYDGTVFEDDLFVELFPDTLWNFYTFYLNTSQTTLKKIKFTSNTGIWLGIDSLVVNNTFGQFYCSNTVYKDSDDSPSGSLQLGTFRWATQCIDNGIIDIIPTIDSIKMILPFTFVNNNEIHSLNNQPLEFLLNSSFSNWVIETNSEVTLSNLIIRDLNPTIINPILLNDGTLGLNATSIRSLQNGTNPLFVNNNILIVHNNLGPSSIGGY